MTANKKQRDTQIPIEAIEGAAGKDDKGITIVAINPVVLGLLNEKMPNKKKTQVTNSVKRPVDPILHLLFRMRNKIYMVLTYIFL